MKRSPELIIALDNMPVGDALRTVDDLIPAGATWFKVGLELFTKAGPAVVQSIKKQNSKVFLDLKLHDIPNTVAKAIESAGDLGADLLTVHASGGPAMLSAAATASQKSNIKVVAVTVLTSLDDAELARVSSIWGNRGTTRSRHELAADFAALAANSGVDGIVCSVPDLLNSSIQKMAWKKPPVFVTPGIRNTSDAVNDQKSVATIKDAVLSGSTHLVIGRPILQPANGTRLEAFKTAMAQIQEAACLLN